MGAAASIPEEHRAKFDEMMEGLSLVEKERAEQHLSQLQGAGVSDPEVLTTLMQSYSDALKGGKWGGTATMKHTTHDTTPAATCARCARATLSAS